MANYFQIIKEPVYIAKSLVALTLFSRPAGLDDRKEQAGQPCVILGNGPSLKETLAKHPSFFKNKIIYCVNDFADSPHFKKIKPKHYLFMDSAFWKKDVSDHFACLQKRYRRALIKDVDWDLTVYLPMTARRKNPFADVPKENPRVSVKYLNCTELYCGKRLKFYLYRHNLAMPKMQNVLVAAIFTAINAGYKKIWLVGADHSWHESIFIDNNNILHLKNDRFHDKKAEKLSPFFEDIKQTAPYRMDNLLRDLSAMFASYRELEEYASSKGSRIYNASIRSFIDAFKRKPLR